MEIKTRNTNTLAPIVYRLLQHHGVAMASRNGPVLRFNEPVSICLTHPRERVHFDPVRDCNPFFHLIEAMAMLGAVNDVELMAHFAKNMREFTDDGETYNAFYGSRARVRWHDQLQAVVDILRKDRDSRQAVVQLWNPYDLTKVTKDKACNLCLLFEVDSVTGSLRMTSFNRSNDAVFGGVSGANIVHLSFFQEFVACALGRPTGVWWHTSNNLHAYVENTKWSRLAARQDSFSDPYEIGFADNPPIFEPGDEVAFTQMIHSFCLDAAAAVRSGDVLNRSYGNFYIQRVLSPVFNAWQLHKRDQTTTAVHVVDAMPRCDWRKACVEWLQRRLSKVQH